MITIKNDCKYSDKVSWCKNKNVKRSLFGIGARCCMELVPYYLDRKVCPFKTSSTIKKPKMFPVK